MSKKQITIEELKQRIEQDIAYLRTVIQDPVSVKYGEQVDFEVRPDNDDDRLTIGREQWGFTTVNYTSEGVIVDVYDENADLVGTVPAFADDLAIGETDLSAETTEVN